MLPPDANTLIAVLAARAQHTPDQTAFTWEGGAHTFEALWDRVNCFAASLLARGIQAGDRVALALPNGPEFFDVFYGIQRAGAIPVPLFPGSGAERIAGVAHRCGARVLVVPSDELAAWQVRVAAVTGAAVQVIPASPDPETPPGAAFPELQPDDIAYLQYTSGSTDLPKGVLLSHDNLLTNIRQLIDAMRITRADIFVSWLPVYHDMGLILMTMVPFYLGAALHLLPTSLTDLGRWLRTVQQTSGTLIAAPDFAYRLCLRAIRHPAGYDLSSLRVALNAAEPVRAATIHAFKVAFGLRHIMIAGYGLAEATVGVATWQPGAPPLIDERGLVSVGRPMGGIDVQIVADDQPVEAGAVGEIMVASPANTRGYYEDPANTVGLFWGDGYIRTGDLGYLDAQGHLFIAGRTKSLIKQAGQPIFPQEVERIVEQLPFVRRAAAVGIDRGGVEGEQLYVFAELRKAGAPSEATGYEWVVEMVQAVHQQIGVRPGRTFLVKPHAIPQTYNGKTQYPALRESYLSGRLHGEGSILYPHPRLTE